MSNFGFFETEWTSLFWQAATFQDALQRHKG